jgi:predicted nucleic acid-binding Zn ribbon protein
MQAMSDPPKKKCEACGGKLEKQISAAGFILKGGGWYKDLYASPKPGSGETSQKADKPEKVDKADKPAKPAEKAEKKKAKGE